MADAQYYNAFKTNFVRYALLNILRVSLLAAIVCPILFFVEPTYIISAIHFMASYVIFTTAIFVVDLNWPGQKLVIVGGYVEDPGDAAYNTRIMISDIDKERTFKCSFIKAFLFYDRIYSNSGKKIIVDSIAFNRDKLSEIKTLLKIDFQSM